MGPIDGWLFVQEPNGRDDHASKPLLLNFLSVLAAQFLPTSNSF
jgi:hypothetical protein